MSARKNSAVSPTLRSSHASKEKVRTIIKTVTGPKFKSPRSSKRVHESSVHTPPSISSPVITTIEGGGLPTDDESLSEGLPQSNQRLDCDELIEDIERVVRNTMSEMFASRGDKENFAISTAVRVPGRYSGEGTDLCSLPVFTSPPAASRNILSR
jgi:hypothetical protein